MELILFTYTWPNGPELTIEFGELLGRGEICDVVGYYNRVFGEPTITKYDRRKHVLGLNRFQSVVGLDCHP